MKMRLSACLIILLSGCVQLKHQTRETEPHALMEIAPVTGTYEQTFVTHIDGKMVQPKHTYRVTPGEHQIIILFREQFGETYNTSSIIGVGAEPQDAATLTMPQDGEPELSNNNFPSFGSSMQPLNIRAEGWRNEYITNTVQCAVGWHYMLDGKQVHKTPCSVPKKTGTESSAKPADTTVEKPAVLALHGAAAMGWADVTERLLCEGAQPDKPDDQGETPLHYAAAAGPEMESLLNAFIEASEKKDFSAFKDFVSEMQDTPFECLIPKQVTDLSEQINDPPEKGGAYTQVAESLLAHGADINAENKKGETPLHYTAMVGNGPVMEYLIQQKADLNIQDKKGNTALNQAAFRGHETVIKLLLEGGADPDIFDNDGYTPLHTAIEKKHFHSVTLFLSHQANPNLTCPNGRGPMHTAAEWGDVETLRLLLEAEASPNAICSSGTPLGRAAANNNKEAVAFLLEHGALPNLPYYRKGLSALHWAALNGHPEMVKTLLDAGANVNLMCAVYGTPLHAASLGHSGVQRVMKKERKSISAKQVNVSVIGSAEDYGQTLRVLLTAHPALNTGDLQYGGTPLSYACMEGNIPAIDLLLQAGANVNATNKFGHTPLHGLARAEIPSLVLSNIVIRLIQAGTDLEARDTQGGTPLHAATNDKKKTVMVKLLIDAGADVNSFGPEKCTPLLLAVTGKNEEAITLLLDAKADPDLPAARGMTTLHTAIALQDRKIITALLQSGADPNATADDGTTALLFCARFHDIDTMKHLVEKGASVTSARKDGWTPLHEAADRGAPEIVEFLLKNGASQEATAKLKARPLHGAANACFGKEERYATVVKLLLAHGAEINVLQNDGQIPLHRSVTWGRPVITQLLLQEGADPAIRDDQGKSARDIAYETNVSRDVIARRQKCIKILNDAVDKPNPITKNKRENRSPL